MSNECLKEWGFFLKRIFTGSVPLVAILFLPSLLFAQMLHPDKPDTAKKCAVCHFQWVYPFYAEHRDGELVPKPGKEVVATEEMCFSCHDGSIADSRNMVFHGPGHRAGVIPSKNISIPDDFPLDEEGKMQCSTCHTPHALSSTPGTGIGVFFRVSNKESSLCRTCHLDKEGGPAKGNHSINVSARKQSPEILKSGGQFGETIPNQIICETCHIAHGGINNKFLVLSAEDTTRSVLCMACHDQNPGLSKSMRSNPKSHPVNVRPQNIIFPFKWSNGEKVAVGSQGELVCRSCHSPHGAVDRKRLLAEHNYKDSLCIKCHQDKKLIAGSSHDLKIFAPDERNINGDRASSLGPCSPCHLVHGGSGELMWARKKVMDQKPGEFCFSCHNPGEPAEKVMPQDFSHPMDISSSSMNFFRSKMKIRCSTCHDLHNPFPVYDDTVKKGVKHGRFLRHSDKGASGVCINCHPRYGLVEGTDHDLRITAPDFTNVYDQTPEQGGLCSPCHVAHKARNQKYLWAAPMGPALLNGWKQAFTTDDNIMTMLCTGCHSPGKIAENHIPQFGLHPKEKIVEAGGSISFELAKNEFPIFTDTGEIAADGNIVCATCHNPHQWAPHIEANGPGRETEGDVTNSFLRPNLHSRFCTECHGKDGLITFKYFHGHISRQKKETPFSFE